MGKGMQEFVCKCGHKLIYKSSDGMCRFSTKVIKSCDDGTRVVAVCRSCNAEVKLPVSIHFFGGSPATTPEEELVKGSRENLSFGVVVQKKD